MTHTYVIGIGMTVFGRHLDRSLNDLTREAVDAALADAGVDRGAIEAAVFSNAAQPLLESINYVRGQCALRPLGFHGIPIVNVENACASATTALHLARQMILAGDAEIVLAVGAEKMNCADKTKSLRLFNNDWDINTTLAMAKAYEPYLVDMELPPIEASTEGRSVVMDAYAAVTRLHMKLFGLTQRQVAEISAKNHRHSVLYPYAQFRKPMTADEVMAGKPLSWPITVPMCAPISDGAAAAVVCSESALKRLAGRSRAVRIAAAVMRGGSDRRPDDFDNHISHLAAKTAYEKAGLGPDDVDVVEVHDATAVGEIVETEALGLFPWGEGGPRGAAGETTLGGRIPVNVSGGLECRGHPLGATGLAQIHELVTQLRGEAGPRQVADARIAMAENNGGLYGLETAAACVTILQR